MSDLERTGPDLWRRYRAAALTPDPTAAAEPDPGLLAAWLDGRLDEVAAEPVEAWLARNPDALCLVDVPASGVEPAPLETIRRARALVSGALPRRTWRENVAWAAIAASLVLVGWTGFMAGHASFDRHDEIASAVGGDLIYGPDGGDGDGAVF